MRRDSRLLKGKAIASLRRCARAFNDFDDDGRTSTVLLHLQHAFEMLLKAALLEAKVTVLDKRSGRSISFKKCAALSGEKLGLTPDQVGLLRAVDALRDDEQHYLGALTEGLLYTHVRAGVTLFDDLLYARFGERLASHLPVRVLPISTEPPQDVTMLFDEQYSQIKELLRPGRRHREEARALIRALLALEGHVAEDVLVSETDVDRIEGAVKLGKPFSEVFPRLGDVTSTVEGSGLEVTVRFTKREGAPVHFVPADDPTAAAAVREVDLQRKYHLTTAALAGVVGLKQPRALALRRHLGIDDDPDCRHVFTHGALKLPSYSDNAARRMLEALQEVDMEEVWARNRPRATRR